MGLTVLIGDMLTVGLGVWLKPADARLRKLDARRVDDIINSGEAKLEAVR